MAELDDQRLDELLTAHFSRELDRHIGRAAQAFAGRAKPPRRIGFAWWIAATAGAAASAALLFLYPNPRLGVRVPSRISPDPAEAIAQAPSAPYVQRAITWQSVDEGTVLLANGAPARQVRQQELQRIRWYDPLQNAEIEMTIPQERVIFVEMETY